MLDRRFHDIMLSHPAVVARKPSYLEEGRSALFLQDLGSTVSNVLVPAAHALYQ